MIKLEYIETNEILNVGEDKEISERKFESTRVFISTPYVEMDDTTLFYTGLAGDDVGIKYTYLNYLSIDGKVYIDRNTNLTIKIVSGLPIRVFPY